MPSYVASLIECRCLTDFYWRYLVQGAHPSQQVACTIPCPRLRGTQRLYPGYCEGDHPRCWPVRFNLARSITVRVLKMCLAVVLLSPVLSSATHTGTSFARRPSSLPRVSTPVPSSTVARRLLSLSATSFPLPNALRVPSSRTLRRKLVTVVRSPGRQATMPPLLATPPMITRRVFVFHLVPRRQSPEAAAQQSELLLVVDVSTSLCLRLVVHSTSTRLSATSTIPSFASPLTHLIMILQLAPHSWCCYEPRRPSSRWW